MKKIIAIVLVCIMALSCTACGLHQGNPEKQEEQLMEFVKKYYGEAEVVEKDIVLLDTATLFTMKDKQDGFTYPITTMEVYMSDLGFVSDAEGTEDMKTIVFDGQFTVHYVANLVKNKIDTTEYNAAVEKYDEVIDIFVYDYESTAANMFTVPASETALLMTEVNKDAIVEMATLMEKYDERKVLNYYIMPVYQATKNGEEIDFVYDKDGAPVVLGYYDFFFNYFMAPEEFDGVTMMHDYFVDSDIQNLKVLAVSNDISSSAVKVEDGFSFAPSTTNSGTFIIVDYNGQNYEFYTLLGYKGFDGEHDEYGIYQGSFLDMISMERTGNKDVMVAYYAMQYPSLYTNLTVHFKPVESIVPEDTETPENGETTENTETNEQEESAE
jgi:hypothetical protein